MHYSPLEEILLRELTIGVALEDEAGLITKINPALVEFLELDEHMLIGAEAAAVLPAIGETVSYFGGNGGRRICKTRSVQMEGRRLWFVEDITALEEAQELALSAERGFRDIIEHTPDCVAIHRHGKFIYVNPSFLKKFGISKMEEILGTDVYRFVHSEDREELAARTEQILNGKSVPMRETTLFRADGTTWVADLTGSLVVFGGEPAIASIARDITEQRRMAARVMQIDRMVTAGTLALGVGHEINNPLSFVNTNLSYGTHSIEKLKGQIQDDSILQELDRLKEALEDALHGGERIRDIVQRLRTFAPGRKTEMGPITLSPIIETALKLVHNQIGITTKVSLTLPEDLPLIWADATSLAQVFLNLFLNASEAMKTEPPAGQVHRLDVEAWFEETWVTVSISDTGMGMSPELVTRIFDPFFTTKEVGQGTGLGLFICQQIVTNHNGRIEVESELGRGSTFRVNLFQTRKL